MPFTPIEGGVQVLLITSRRRGRLILPKGWPIPGRSLADSAAQEAAEEAGVLGRVGAEPIGSYRYMKETQRGYDVRCHVFVYPLLVLHHSVAWDERSERTLRWVQLAEAARLADDRGLRTLLAKLSDDGALPLLELAARSGLAAGAPAPRAAC